MAFENTSGFDPEASSFDDTPGLDLQASLFGDTLNLERKLITRTHGYGRQLIRLYLHAFTSVEKTSREGRRLPQSRTSSGAGQLSAPILRIEEGAGDAIPNLMTEEEV